MKFFKCFILIFLIQGCNDGSDTVQVKEWVIDDSNSIEIDFLDNTELCIDEPIKSVALLFDGTFLPVDVKKADGLNSIIKKKGHSEGYIPDVFTVYPVGCTGKEPKIVSITKGYNNTYYIPLNKGWERDLFNYPSPKSVGSEGSYKTPGGKKYKKNRFKGNEYDDYKDTVFSFRYDIQNKKDIASIGFRFHKDNKTAQAFFYDKKKTRLGKGILYNIEININDRKRNVIHFNSMSCNVYQKHNKLKIEGVFIYPNRNEEVSYPNCDNRIKSKNDLKSLATLYDVIKMMEKEKTIVKNSLMYLRYKNAFNQITSNLSFTLQTKAPREPIKPLGIDFGNILSTDLAPEIVKKYK